MWKIIVQRDMPQLTIWRMRIACFIAKAKNTYSDTVLQVILIMFKYVEHSTYFSMVFYFILLIYLFAFSLIGV
jgi:hypothetical protein